MRVTVRLFAVLREAVGKEEIDLEVPPGTDASEVLKHLKRQFAIDSTIFERSAIALNGELTKRSEILSPGDELAILPPVSGG